MDRTNCRPGAVSSRTSRALARQEIGTQSRRPVRMRQIQIPEATGRAEETAEVRPPVARILGPLHNESFPFIHPASGRHLLADDRRSAGRHRRLPAATCVGAAGSGLSDDPGNDLLPGRGPDSNGSSVTAPLERQFGQVPGLSQMTSTSSLGSSIITLQFNLDQNIDIAEQEVQAAINSAGTYLPTDLPNLPIYSKVNPADAPILTLALTSDTLPLSKVEDLAD